MRAAAELVEAPSNKFQLSIFKDMEKRYTYRQLAAMSARELDNVAMHYGLVPAQLQGMRNNEIITFIIRKQANL